MTTPTVAAIDCGTNSTRLLVRAPDGTTLERLMRITRLGKGVDATGRLDPDAIDRTVDVLREFREVMDRFGVDRVRMSATSASRDAANREDFFGPAEQVIGVAPELLVRGGGRPLCRSSARRRTSMRRVAPFSWSTSAADRPSSPTAPTSAKRPCRSTSAASGSPRSTSSTTRRCPRSCRPASRSSRCSSTTSCAPSPKSAEAPTFVGLAGTITTVAAVELGLQTYDREKVHHFVLSKAAAEDVFRTLATEPFDERGSRIPASSGNGPTSSSVARASS